MSWSWLDAVEIIGCIVGVSVIIFSVTIPAAFLLLAITDSRWFGRLEHWFFGILDKIKTKHKK